MVAVAKGMPTKRRLLTLDAPTEIDGFVWPAGTRIKQWFDRNDHDGRWQNSWAIPTAEITITGVTFAAGKKIQTCIAHSDERQTRCLGGILARDQQVNEVPLRGGSEAAIVTDVGHRRLIHLMTGTLGRDFSAAGTKWPPGSRLFFGLLWDQYPLGMDTEQFPPYAPSDVVRALAPSPTTIAGLPSKGRATFYPGGKLHDTDLADPVRIGGILCLPGEVKLYASGALTYCADQPGQVVGGLPVRSVSLFEDGRLNSATLDAASVVDGVRAPAGAHLSWDKGQRRLDVQGEEGLPPLELGSLRCVQLYLHRPGVPSRCYPKGAIDIGALPVSHVVTFHANGEVRSARLARATTISGVKLGAGTVVRLRPGGALEEAVLGEDQPVQAGGRTCWGQQGPANPYFRGHPDFDDPADLVLGPKGEVVRCRAQPAGD